jgi:hypothetical protein
MQIPGQNRQRGEMKGLPRVIYLQVWGDQPKESGVKFADFSEVSWCQERVFDTDYRYVLKAEKPKKRRKPRP